jgi:ribosomal protein L16 Arg81 hydroxylase
MTRRALAGLAVVAAMVAAGCGGPSAEEQFSKDKLRPAQQRIEQQKSQLSAQLQVVHLGRKRDAQVIGDMVERLRAAVNALARLKPPASLDQRFHKYVVAHRHLVAALQRFARLLAGTDESALNREADKAQNAAGEVARARDALDEKILAAMRND